GTRFRLAGYSLNRESRPLAGVDVVIIYAPTSATIDVSAPPGAALPFWSGSDGSTYTATLEAGQTLALRTVVGRDLHGALLTASAPVAASSGGRGWSVDDCGDDGMDGLVPTSALGREHVVRLPSGSASANGESNARVIADADGTAVRVNGALVATLAAGAQYSFVPSALSYVQTSLPALVWMNGSLSGCELDTVLIPPIAFAPALTELSLDFNVPTSSEVPSAEMAILIAETQAASVLLDGVSPALTSTEPVPGRSDLVYLRFNVAQGDHNVRAGADFQAMLASRTQPSGLLAYYNPYRIPGCGDGALDPGEGCDDQNQRDGDGCSARCSVEPGYGCSGAPSVCVTVCGDGVVSADESCDDANRSAGDGCNSTCRRELTIAVPAAGETVRVALPSFSGSADPGAAVTLSLAGNTASPSVDAQGNWSFVPAAAVPEGELTLLASATDVRGGVSMATRSVLIDSMTSVTITAPTQDAVSTSAQPSIRGTGEPLARIDVSLESMSVGATVVRADGSWELALTSALPEGPKALVATATDASGNVATTGPVRFVIDTRTEVTITAPGAGATLPGASLELVGRGEPAANVTLRVDDTLLVVVTVDESGRWNTSLAETLRDGWHSVSAHAVDAAGNRANFTVDFRTDSRTGPTLMIHHPPDGAHVRDPNLVFSGAADPGAAVVLSFDGVTLDTLMAGLRGSFRLQLLGPLTPGQHTLRAETVDAAGRRAQDEHRFTFDVDTTPVTITAPRAGSVVASATPTLSGTSAAGARIQAWVDDEPSGEATAGADGRWSIALQVALLPGHHALRVTASDSAANEGSAETGFYVETAIRSRLRVPAPDATVGSTRPTLVGFSAPLAGVRITLDGVEVAQTDVGLDGAWSWTLTEPLAPGAHTLVVVVLDQVGNEARSERTFVHDPSLPDDDGDGRPNAEECAPVCRDTDGDGANDEYDDDDDGDGLLTALECSAAPCRDTDADSRADYLDPDDDDDGRPSADEHAGVAGRRDGDYDGLADHVDADDDGDGAATALECATPVCADTDGDALDDWRDADDDNDGLPSAYERHDSARLATDDADEDGSVNWLDSDANANGVDDVTDGTSDEDGDGVPNYLDRDLEV
ncbi:MAG TPA: Ig-like domain-containing protein, partial [Polyangiales bacterium]